MSGYTSAQEKVILDYVHPTSGNTQHVGYSTNGSSEASILARTAIGATGWASATGGSPSVKANNSVLTSAAASGAGTITHYAIFTASSGGTQLIDWEELDAPRTVASSDVLTWAISDLKVTLD